MKLGLFFFIAALFLFIPDAYVTFVVMAKTSWWLRGLFLLPTLVYFLIIGRTFLFKNQRQSLINMVLWSTLAIFFPIVVFSTVSLVGLMLSCLSASLYRVFNWIGVALSSVWLIGVVYGITKGWKKVTVERIALKFPVLPNRFRGYRIVQLSDFHIGTYLSSPHTVMRIVESVNSLNPDLIVFTGDLVNVSPDEIKPFVHELKQLKAKDGVISILGNHDYCLYRTYIAPDSPLLALKEVIELEREMGWKILLNQSVTIRKGEEHIAVIGVENAGDKHFVDKSDLKRAMRDVGEDDFKILLSHDPTHWRREVVNKTDINLTLSGHTHAMQLKIRHFSPAKWIYREWGGVYREKGQVLVVSTGTGGNVAFRLGAYPQILEIVLDK